MPARIAVRSIGAIFKSAIHGWISYSRRDKRGPTDMPSRVIRAAHEWVRCLHGCRCRDSISDRHHVGEDRRSLEGWFIVFDVHPCEKHGQGLAFLESAWARSVLEVRMEHDEQEVFAGDA